MSYGSIVSADRTCATVKAAVARCPDDRSPDLGKDSGRALPSAKRVRLTLQCSGFVAPGASKALDCGDAISPVVSSANSVRVERGLNSLTPSPPTACLTQRACGPVPSRSVLAQVLRGLPPQQEFGRAGMEYAADALRWLLLQERRCMPLPNYFEKHRDIDGTARGVLVDWLVAVHKELSMRSKTLHLAVSLCDRYLCVARPLPRERLHLAVVTALLVATKFEEKCDFEVASAVEITDNMYTAREITCMERAMLNGLEFEVDCPTAEHFMPVMQAVVRAQLQRTPHYGLSDLLGLPLGGTRAAERVETKASYLVELSLLDVTLTQFLPSQVAAAAIVLSRKSFDRTPHWPPVLEKLVGHSEVSLKYPSVATWGLR